MRWIWLGVWVGCAEPTGTGEAPAAVVDVAGGPLWATAASDVAPIAGRLARRFSPVSGGFGLTTRAFHATVDGAGLALTPTARVPAEGPDQDELVIPGEPARLSTVAVRRGGERLDAPARAPEARGDEIRRSYGPVTEAFRASDAGVEQRWYLDEEPAGLGALTVEVRVDGLAFIGADTADLRFADPTGLGVTYGASTWVDAAGTRTTVDARWTGAAVEITVPEDVLAETAWPAVLDPVVSPAFNGEQRGYFSDTADRGTWERESQIACLAEGCLAVFTDERFDPGFGDIWATRVNDVGWVMDVGGFRVTATTARRERDVRIVANGSGYALTWTEDPPSFGEPPKVWLQELDADGAALRAPVLVGEWTEEVMPTPASVVPTDDGWLVFLTARPGSSSGGAPTLTAANVEGGAVVSRQTYTVDRSFGDDPIFELGAPAAARWGERVLLLAFGGVAFDPFTFEPNYTVYQFETDLDGVPFYDTALSIHGGLQQSSNVALACDPESCLYALTEMDSTGSNGEVLGRALRRNDSTVVQSYGERIGSLYEDPMFGVSSATPSIVYTAGEFAVAWDSADRLFARRVDRSGAAIGAVRAISSGALNAPAAGRPRLAARGAEVMVAYGVSGLSSAGAEVNRLGSTLTQSYAARISDTVINRQESPSIAGNGQSVPRADASLLAWVDDVGSGVDRVMVQCVGAGGPMFNPLMLGSATQEASRPWVGTSDNNLSFPVVWTAREAGGASVVLFTTVTCNGTSGATGTPIREIARSGSGESFGAAVTAHAYNAVVNRRFAIVAFESLGLIGQDIQVVYVNLGATNLSQRISLRVLGGTPGFPDSAPYSQPAISGEVIAFTRWRSDGTGDIYGARANVLRFEAANVDVPAPIATNPWSERAPSVACPFDNDGRNACVVVWEDARNGEADVDIAGVSVAQPFWMSLSPIQPETFTGTRRVPPQVLAVTGPGSALSPRIAPTFSGDVFAMTWSERGSFGEEGALSARVVYGVPSGEVTDRPGLVNGETFVFDGEAGAKPVIAWSRQTASLREQMVAYQRYVPGWERERVRVRRVGNR